ncbi:hypothetical protein SDC9_167821 [bioreactor metagenome]|uniref:Uncharacterized protein n=1 Tax=bioreactor metagenome TaxID=1076179 RepID=A0A645G3C3_9ZZZZ
MALHPLDIEHHHIQLAGGRYLGVLLPHGAGSRVSRIGEQGLTVLLPCFVQGSKYRAGHKHLAPDDDRDRLRQI